MSEWQPINTAPKDGTPVLGWDEADKCFHVASNDGDGYWVEGIEICEPTHWMPLPEPPKA